MHRGTTSAEQLDQKEDPAPEMWARNFTVSMIDLSSTL